MNSLSIRYDLLRFDILESKCYITGVDHVLEQRVTTIGVSLLMGLFAFGGSYLRLPLASLFGVFLYLGIMNLTGVQFVQRIILFFIPEKYFPDISYTESVKIV